MDQSRVGERRTCSRADRWLACARRGRLTVALGGTMRRSFLYPSPKYPKTGRPNTEQCRCFRGIVRLPDFRVKFLALLPNASAHDYFWCSRTVTSRHKSMQLDGLASDSVGSRFMSTMLLNSYEAGQESEQASGLREGFKPRLAVSGHRLSRAGRQDVLVDPKEVFRIGTSLSQRRDARSSRHRSPGHAPGPRRPS